jgi:hypothetical protein
MADADGFWTLQQFDRINGQPWYILLKHDCFGAVRAWAGYRHELDSLARAIGITPEELPPATGRELLSRINLSAFIRPVERNG